MFPKHSNSFELFISRMKKTFNSLGLGNLPIYLTEWNFTLSHRNLVNDTCFKSCYILKNLLDNYDRLDSFGYWCLTDLLEENSLPNSLFHGGLGIYTMNGLRKSVFYAFYFANMLGDDLVDSGDGYFITRKNSSYQIISYNYIHYGDLFASGELFDITETQRYSAFNMAKQISLSISLEKIPPGNYEIKEYFVNKEKGSAFDIWIDFGGLPLNPRDTELLKGLCAPGFHIEKKQISDGKLKYSALLKPLEIRFAEIKQVE
jgi:xylan 1,4-beta-xylosidase